MVHLKLSHQEMELLFRQDPAATDEDERRGQSLLVTLRELTNAATGEVSIPTRVVERIHRCAFVPGGGNWENRLMAIFGRTMGPRLGYTGAARDTTPH